MRKYNILTCHYFSAVSRSIIIVLYITDKSYYDLVSLFVETGESIGLFYTRTASVLGTSSVFIMCDEALFLLAELFAICV